MEADVAPVINNYKWSFFTKRFTENILGGMKIYTGRRQPFMIYVMQILLYLLPLLFVTPFIVTANYSLYPHIAIPISCAGVCMAVLVFITQTIAFIAPRVKKSEDPFGTPVDIVASMLDEDDEIEKFFSRRAMVYWLPSRRNYLFVLVNSLLSGLLAAGIVWTLRPERVKYHFTSEVFGWIVFAIGLFVYLNCQYSLTVRAPPEISQFQSYSIFEEVLRPMYVLLFILSDVICAIIFSYETIYWIEYVNCVIYIVFLLYPVLWSLGILAHVNVLFLWATEVALVYLLGGTHAASDKRLFIMALFAWISSTVVFLLYYFLSPALGVFIAAGLGFALSQEWYIHYCELLPSLVLSRLPESVRQRFGFDKVKYQTIEQVVHQAFPKVAIWRIISAAISILSILGCLGAGLALHFTNTVLPSRSSQNELWFKLTVGIIEAIMLLTVVTHWILLLTQRIYLFNILRNPLWRKIQSSKVTRAIHIITRCAPTVAMAYLLINVDTKAVIPIASSEWFLYSFFECVLILRSFRFAWQNVWSSYLEIVIVAILNKACVNTGWYDLSMATRLFIIGFGLSRLPVLWDRSRLMGISWITVASNSKYRFKRAKLFLILTIIFIPIPLLVLVVSSVMILPILPLLGIPLFIIGFPRPLRTWPTCGSSYSLCSDTVFYKHMLPAVLSNFSRKMGRGSLGTIHPGDMFLIRSETFFVLVEILERGLGYVTINIKGLELQTTSCHAVEATLLDEFLEGVYAPKSEQVINKHFWHIFQPMSETLINTYSISNIQLTGLFDHPDTFTELHQGVAHCLLWIICNNKTDTELKSALIDYHANKVVPLQQDQIDNVFPKDWLEFLKKDCPTMDTETEESIKLFVSVCFLVIEQQMGKKISPNEILKTFAGTVPGFNLDKMFTRNKKDSMHFDDYQHAFSMIEEELDKFNKKKQNKTAGPKKEVSEHVPTWLKGDDNEDTKSIERGEKLLQYFIKAYQWAVKLSLDKIVYEGSNLTAPNESEFEEWRDSMVDYDQNWDISCKQDDSSILEEKPNIFVLVVENAKKSVSEFRAKSFTKQDMPFYIGKLDAETVRAIWTSLNLELFFFTNDDDERYSIQAHKLMMRNICVQAAEPPLGYPIFSSGPINVPILT